MSTSFLANAADGPQYEHDAGLLADITQTLQPYLGAYSIATVKRASRSAPTAHDLVRVVASHIEDVGKRELFLKAVKRVVAQHALQAELADSETSNAAADAIGVTPEHLQRGEAALAPFVGPLASVLASRYAAQAHDPREFYERLAAHLRTPEERDGFFMSLRAVNRPRHPLSKKPPDA